LFGGRLPVARVVVCFAQSHSCIYIDHHSWNKLLPKKGETFDSVMTHLNSTNVPEISNRYAWLYEQIVQCKVASFKDTINVLHTTHAWQPRDALMSPGRPYDEAYVEFYGL
jgi:hypothetical protein